MNLIPDPLHPAIVHFPIVLIVLGAATAVGAVFWRRHQVPVIAALLLLLGALGTWAAIETGESAGGLLASGSAQRQALLDAHQTWAERTLSISIVAAVLAAGSVAVARWPRLARAAAVLAALISAAATYGIYETGHRGGALVYRHAAGVELAAAGPTAQPESGPSAPAGQNTTSARD